MEGGRRSKRPRLMSTDDKEEDKRMKTRLQERRHREESLRAVLSNHVVSENIASFLSLNDMKAASGVNRPFLQAIRGTQHFAQEAVLAITDKNAQKATLEKTEYSWRGVRIDGTDSSDILDDLSRVLQSAQFVSLGAPPGKIKNANRAKDPTAAHLLTTVFNSTPALAHLQIGTDFLFADLQTVLSSPAVQEILRNLTRLEFLMKKDYRGQNFIDLNVQDANEEKKRFERNFRLLMELPNRLKTFDLIEMFPATWMKNKNTADQSVLRLLRNNTRTMEQLSLNWKVWKLQELGTLTFPGLKTLSAIVKDEDEEETLVRFLEKQRSLEELTVRLTFFYDECLVTIMRRRCLELKKLDVTTEYFSGDVEECSFLGSMNRLKEFRFKSLETAGVTNGWRLLAFLPKNQLERLSLEGISTERYGFWSAGGVGEPEFEVKTELLEGFRCLRKLSFLGSRDAVDDQLMQWLLKEFPSLEELELSYCSALTDAGISGKTAAEWGRDASFADLRRLKTLKIVECAKVTPNGVLESCVNVPSLRSLEYTYPLGPIVESAVLQFVEQSPRLEKLSLDYVGDLEKLQAKVMKKNPRVELSLAEEDDW